MLCAREWGRIAVALGRKLEDLSHILDKAKSPEGIAVPG